MYHLKCIRKNYWVGLLAGAVCLMAWNLGNVQAAETEKFPTKTIKIIIPNSPGGATDTEPRWFAPHLGKHLGIKVIIENLPGADGKIALTKGWRANPDGYTLLYHGVPQTIMTEHLHKPEFKTLGFTYLLGLYTSNTLLCVHADHWKSMEEFLNAARIKTMAGGISSRGSTAHINGLLMAEKFGLNVNWVPFHSSGEILSSLAGKHLDFAIMSPETVQPMVAAGKIRPLMVYAEKPDQMYPEVPLPNKLGYNLNTISAIRGFIAPPNTPAARAKILERAMLATARDPAYMEWAKKRNVEIAAMAGSKYIEETKKQIEVLEKYKRLF